MTFARAPTTAGAVQDADVQAKQDAAVKWCGHATDYSLQHGGKPWRYVLIPHDMVSDNMTLEWLVQQFVRDTGTNGKGRLKP